MGSHVTSIPDAVDRHLAATTFDRNIVVVAGAGTGKTTLLVNRLVHLLMREPRPVAITRLLALTFTNKAATEMRVRLRERLTWLATGTDASELSEGAGAVTLRELRERYGLSTDQIAARALTALHNLEQAQIATLHSFAAHLLRLYPLESGVDPAFRTDEDHGRFAEHFAQCWEAWLDRELQVDGPEGARWRRVLGQYRLEQVRRLAMALCSPLIPLEELRWQVEGTVLPPALRQWLACQRDRANALVRKFGPTARPRKIETLLAAAHAVFSLLAEQGAQGIEHLDARHRQALEGEAGKAPSGWDGEAFAEAKRLVALARSALLLDQSVLQDLLALLCPFVEEVRRSFLRQGLVTFDGLLTAARDLLRNYPAIREHLKHEFQAVLVDEFQDTDPVQYEIILYLAERPGSHATDWRTVELEPGKLCIVGDPKQSIYGFRRADIEAFERVVHTVTATGGIECTLTTNFRSDARVLEVVNPLFDRLFVPQEHVQPPNVPLRARPDRSSGLLQPGVELRVVRTDSGDEEVDSAQATRLEADQLARWIKEELLAREMITGTGGRCEPLRPGHIALLFRKLTQAQDYLEALERHGLPYVTDGEKHFYRRQEIIDVINVLRAIDQPYDAIALAGVLRSLLGGVTDRELVEVCERGALDYRQVDRLVGWDSPNAQVIRELYGRLEWLHRTVPALPLPEALDRVFEALPLLELAAASLHGEQAVVNLLKLRQMAEQLAERPQLTFTAFVELLMTRLDEQQEEAESALAEESLDAVRVLTIHKAKGLEFPVVILPGLHQGTGLDPQVAPVSYDWATGVLGLAVGQTKSLGALLTHEKARLREEAECRRLFYVGMTRARERLVLSSGWPARLASGSFLGLLKEAIGEHVGDAAQPFLAIGTGRLAQTVVTVNERPPHRGRKGSSVRLTSSSEWKEVLARWGERDRVWTRVRAQPIHTTPTSHKHAEWVGTQVPHQAAESERHRLVGTLAHRLLAHWDFSRGPERLAERVAAVCRQGLPRNWLGHAPDIERELVELFETFLQSEPYGDLARATIVGREVPFMFLWEGAGCDPSREPRSRPGLDAACVTPCVMEGVIDVLYRLDGRFYLADYKTDRVEDGALMTRALAYREQMLIYREAVSRCLGIPDPEVRLIFVRYGQAVSV